MPAILRPMTPWVLVRLPATSYAFRHPTLARNMQGMPRMGRLAAATSSPFPCEAREKGLKTAAPSLPGQPEDPRLWRRAPNGAAIQGVESHPDGPPRMVKRPTGSGGEPSSPNCGASAGVKARHLIFLAHFFHTQAEFTASTAGVSATKVLFAHLFNCQRCLQGMAGNLL